MIDFRRIAIVNRGEPAVRLIRAVRELDYSVDNALTTIALYTDPDRHATFVREADEAFHLGPALIDVDGERKSSYLVYPVLERALTACKADAVWVGWGFVAEHAEFAELCAKLGIVFIGPPPEAMRRLGDKIGSKLLAEQMDVPVSPWSGGPVETLEQAKEHAVRIGFPLLVKAAAGGGGRGIRKVTGINELEQAFETSRSEARKAFGDGTVFLEKMVLGARHIEVQILGDKHGTVWPVGVRDCSIQRRNQKVIEEAPSAALSPEVAQRVMDSAVRMAKGAGYYNAGTAEYLFEEETGEFYFMEMNTRLQVEHPVTEATTGLDMVKLQLLVAAGDRLQGDPPPTVGHAIEVRLNAEDPDNNFAPAPGNIVFFRLPGGAGVRVDAGVGQGDTIPADFDSMIGKLIVFGKDRQEAISRLRRALDETAIAVDGGTTNRSFLNDLITHPDFVSGKVNIAWLDKVLQEERGLRPCADVALVQVAIEAHDEELVVDQRRLLSSLVRGRPRMREEIGLNVEVRLAGQTYKMKVSRVGRDDYRVILDDRWVDVRVARQNRYERLSTVGRKRHRILLIKAGVDYMVEVDGYAHRISRDEGGVVRAPAPGIVLSIPVRAGDRVVKGETLAVLEAMKMEMPVTAPVDGQVRAVSVAANVQIDAGAPLVELEPEAGAQQSSMERVRLTPREGTSMPREQAVPADFREVYRERCRKVLGELAAMILGYDIDPREMRGMLREYATVRDDMEPDDPEMLQLEQDLFDTFSDVVGVGAPMERETQSPTTLLTSRIRRLQSRQEDVPEAVAEKFRRLFRHHGVADLDDVEEVERAAYWSFRANARVAMSSRVVERILERHWRHEAVAADNVDYRKVLDRLIAESRGRCQEVNALARQLRYRRFDWPVLLQAREEFQVRQREGFAALIASTADSQARAALMSRITDSPYPVLPMLHGAYCDGPDGDRGLLLEIYLRRFYRKWAVGDVAIKRGRLAWHALGAYSNERGVRVGIEVTFLTAEEVEDGFLEAIEQAKTRHAQSDMVLDLLVAIPDEMSASVLQEIVEGLIESHALPPSVLRLCVSGLNAVGSFKHLTYRRSENGLVHEPLYQGIHHMQAEQLELWRLRNFDVERVSVDGGGLVFRAIAKENRKDKRLLGFMDVRDLSTTRDAQGQIVEFPHLERLYGEVLATMRETQHRYPKERYDWNRVYIYPWSPLKLDSGDLNRLAQRLAQPTQELGVEEIVLRARGLTAQSERDSALHITVDSGTVMRLRLERPSRMPIEPHTDYSRRVMACRRRGMAYPYEIIKMLTPKTEGTSVLFPLGDFVEYDLDDSGELVPVERPHGRNTANIVVGLIVNYTSKYPDGITRVVLLGDPTREMGSLAEPECVRTIKALDMAESLGVPLEWFPVSAGAKISMVSGTENLDWTARVVRRIVEFVDRGGEVNVVVNGVNVGAQSYWNAEATMLMHARGILVMTPKGSMVLTGKKALDYSGGVSAEDNQGIGGVNAIMGPNGQAQYNARDITQACIVLYHHYDCTYVVPGERFPRRGRTRDPLERDIRRHPHASDDECTFATVGEIFSDETNPGRKKPFDIRSVMRAVIDQDHAALERWALMRDAETAVVMDVHVGGIPVCMIGIESKRLSRHGFVPGDGPDMWMGGTLFPLSSRKVARAINSASNNRPVVVLANLAGFDGSPESMRKLQLEYGAEIGRAVVRFKGPMVFCVISRYHGGAYVVFSRALNEHMESAALHGSFASVIGGAPATAVVFPSEVRARTFKDPGIEKLREAISSASPDARPRLYAKLNGLEKTVRARVQREVAEEFDGIHNIERAKAVGSLDAIVAPGDLRRYVVEALERGIGRFVDDYGAGIDASESRS